MVRAKGYLALVNLSTRLKDIFLRLSSLGLWRNEIKVNELLFLEQGLCFSISYCLGKIQPSSGSPGDGRAQCSSLSSLLLHFFPCHWARGISEVNPFSSSLGRIEGTVNFYGSRVQAERRLGTVGWQQLANAGL